MLCATQCLLVRSLGEQTSYTTPLCTVHTTSANHAISHYYDPSIAGQYLQPRSRLQVANAGDRTIRRPLPQDCSSESEQSYAHTAGVPSDSDADAASTLQGWIKKVPEEVVAVARFGGAWRFKIGSQESTVPSSLFVFDDPNDELALESSNSIRIVWNTQWIHAIPGDLDRDRYLDLAKTLDGMTDASKDFIWLQKCPSYTVEDTEGKHICLEQACLDSEGTECPSFTATAISKQLADRVDASEDRQADRLTEAAKRLGKVVLDIHNCYPGDMSRTTAAVLDLAMSDNPLRRLMRA